MTGRRLATAAVLLALTLPACSSHSDNADQQFQTEVLRGYQACTMRSDPAGCQNAELHWLAGLRACHDKGGSAQGCIDYLRKVTNDLW